eukprot:1115156-Pelagomonas_calceolata.AAC.3
MGKACRLACVLAHTCPAAMSGPRTAADRAERSPARQNKPVSGILFLTPLARLEYTQFEELCMDLFKGGLDHVDRCLRDAKMDKSKVHEVVLVGGSTRIPRVRSQLQTMVLALTLLLTNHCCHTVSCCAKDFFNGKELNLSMNPDEAVACGAAVQAAVLTGEGGEKVYEGEHARNRDNKLLGGFELSGIRPAPKGQPEIRVVFDIDVNFILNVLAKDKSSGSQKQKTITGKGCLTKDDIERMVQKAEKDKAEDKALQEQIRQEQDLQKKVELKRNMFKDEKDKAEDEALQEQNLQQEEDHLKEKVDARTRCGIDIILPCILLEHQIRLGNVNQR